MLLRIIAGLSLIPVSLFFPWWLALLLAAGYSIIFPRYYELLALGIFIDSMFGTAASAWGGFKATILALSIFVALSIIRERLR